MTHHLVSLRAAICIYVPRKQIKPALKTLMQSRATVWHRSKKRVVPRFFQVEAVFRIMALRLAHRFRVFFDKFCPSCLLLFAARSVGDQVPLDLHPAQGLERFDFARYGQVYPLI